MWLTGVIVDRLIAEGYDRMISGLTETSILNSPHCRGGAVTGLLANLCVLHARWGNAHDSAGHSRFLDPRVIRLNSPEYLERFDNDINVSTDG